MRHLILLISFMVISGNIYSQNQAPLISNINTQLCGNENTGSYFIHYTVTDAENDSVIVKLEYSLDGGEHFYYTPLSNELLGDIGALMPTGQKSFEWQYNLTGYNPANVVFKLTATDRQPIAIQTIVDAVDINRLMADMTFVEGARHYTSNPSHIAAIKDTIYNRFNAAGLQALRQGFTAGAFNNAENIIGTLAGHGRERETCIVDAHFDSVSNAPGADDNGSGVLGVLEVMRVLAPYHFERSIKFIGFDLEELGLLGSIKYITDGINPQENIVGVFNYEMIGYYADTPNSQTVPAGFNLLYPDLYAQLQADQFRGNFLTSVANIASNPLKTLFDSCATAYVPALKVMSLAIPGNGEIAPDFRRSDHAGFWDTNRPALMLTDGANFRNPNYHTNNDVSSVLNFEFMANNVKAVVAAAATLARPLHSTALISPVTEICGATNDISTKSNLTISPNPTLGQVRVSWTNNNSSTLQPTLLQVFDSKGKQCRQLNISPNMTEINLDLSNMPAGVYYISSDKGQKQMVKVQ